MRCHLVQPRASKQISVQPKSMEIYPTVFRMVLIGISLAFHMVKAISPTRKHVQKEKGTGQHLRLHSEARRRKTVTEEIRDWQSELGR